eukprot:COSAG06_NODE_26688_length_609_cov_0.945098_1_plen_45_part_10
MRTTDKPEPCNHGAQRAVGSGGAAGVCEATIWMNAGLAHHGGAHG